MSNPNNPNQNPGQQQQNNPRPGQQQGGGGQKPGQQQQGGQQKPGQQPGQGGQHGGQPGSLDAQLRCTMAPPIRRGHFLWIDGYERPGGLRNNFLLARPGL